MGFQIKKVSDHGTSNPIVARLLVQTGDLLGFSTLPKERKEEVLILYHDEVMPRLLACDTISQRVAKSMEDIFKLLEKEGPSIQAGGRVIEVPQVMNLQQDAEQYLYSAKCVLRDVASVFKIFFGKEFTGAKYDKVLKWCGERFGADHALTKLIREDHDLWLHQLITMRNAVEHPDTLRLRVRNIELVGDKLSLPTWQLNDQKPCDLTQDMLVYIENMLTFCEDLLVAGIENTGKFAGIGFAEIAKEDRRQECPIRLKAVFVGKGPSK
jgi:hypothetical protein